jgi:hypothetical protein
LRRYIRKNVYEKGPKLKMATLISQPQTLYNFWHNLS